MCAGSPSTLAMRLQNLGQVAQLMCASVSAFINGDNAGSGVTDSVIGVFTYKGIRTLIGIESASPLASTVSELISKDSE